MFFYSENQFLSASGGGLVSDLTLGGKTYRIHKFTSNSTITFANPGTVEYLIVGGGAAGGSGFYGVVSGISYAAFYIGNGGDSGKILTGSINVDAKTYSINIGAASSGNGNSSSAFNLTASGGTFNGSAMSPRDGIGASLVNKNGLQSSIDGTARYYGGGGGAGGGSAGGLGGGGSGGINWSGNPGTANTGGGGGGGQRDNSGFSKSGGIGASGIIIVRYQIA